MARQRGERLSPTRAPPGTGDDPRTAKPLADWPPVSQGAN